MEGTTDCSGIGWASASFFIFYTTTTGSPILLWQSFTVPSKWVLLCHAHTSLWQHCTWCFPKQHHNPEHGTTFTNRPQEGKEQWFTSITDNIITPGPEQPRSKPKSGNFINRQIWLIVPLFFAGWNYPGLGLDSRECAMPALTYFFAQVVAVFMSFLEKDISAFGYSGVCYILISVIIAYIRNTPHA